MRVIRPIKVIVLIFSVLISTTTANSQVLVERSKDKVIISGIAYYIHQVRKGETAYSISRAYGITVEDLTRENPPAIYGINEGQTLRIPVRLVNGIKPVQSPLIITAHDDTKFIYHSLKPGETVYSLSKSYGVSANEIVESNPGIDINKLSIGTEIVIPKRAFMNNQQKFDDQENKYAFHKVQQGETLSSIAKQYGLTVRQLRRENRDLRFPQVGDFVRIPGAKKVEIQEVEQIKTDTVIVAPEDLTLKNQRSSGYTPVKELVGSFNVSVLLPFYLKENSARFEIDSSKMVKGRKVYKVNKVADDWIYPGSIDFLEMYEGILLASDSLRSMGLNINIHTYDIKSDTISVLRLIESGQLAGTDLIIGPVYSKNLSIVSGYARNLGIIPEYVCFDSKFSSKKLLNMLDSFGWIYFTQLAANRVFNGEQLKMRRFQPYSEEGNLKGVGHKVNITKYCKRYYATNATGKSITSKYIVNHYRVRWAIEVLFRSLKQLCHLQDCQSKHTHTQRHYVFMCIQAFMKLQDQNEKSVYQAKKLFQQKYLRIKINGNKALRQAAA
jgi:LysM repeat protein